MEIDLQIPAWLAIGIGVTIFYFVLLPLVGMLIVAYLDA
jgi:hypothetical protein